MVQTRHVWNVTQIRPPGFLHAHALDDAAQYLVHTLVACGEPAQLSSNQLAADATTIVVGAHLVTGELPAATILFNSEPRAEWTPAYAQRLARHEVWDYSTTNATGPVIPFLYCPAMARPTRPLGAALLFYGSQTPRRVAILDALRASGVRLDVAFGTYGADRDARLARAAAVLNLHKTDDPSTFEPIRCFYPLHGGLPVISEDTTDPAADDFRDSVAFAAIADLGAAFAARDPVQATRFVATSGVERVRAILRSRTARR